jgi:hypothetical protein
MTLLLYDVVITFREEVDFVWRYVLVWHNSALHIIYILIEAKTYQDDTITPYDSLLCSNISFFACIW